MLHLRERFGADRPPVALVAGEDLVERAVLAAGDDLVVHVGLEAQVAPAQRQRQVGALLTVGLGFLPGVVADHHRVARVVALVREPDQAHAQVGGRGEAAEVGNGLLHRAVLPEVLGVRERGRGDHPHRGVPARHEVAPAQVGALDEHADLAVRTERLAVGLDAEAGRESVGEIVVHLEIQPPDLEAVQVASDRLARAVDVDRIHRVGPGAVVGVPGIALGVVEVVREGDSAHPAAGEVRRRGDDGGGDRWRLEAQEAV